MDKAKETIKITVLEKNDMLDIFDIYIKDKKYCADCNRMILGKNRMY